MHRTGRKARQAGQKTGLAADRARSTPERKGGPRHGPAVHLDRRGRANPPGLRGCGRQAAARIRAADRHLHLAPGLLRSGGGHAIRRVPAPFGRSLRLRHRSQRVARGRRDLALYGPASERFLFGRPCPSRTGGGLGMASSTSDQNIRRTNGVSRGGGKFFSLSVLHSRNPPFRPSIVRKSPIA